MVDRIWVVELESGKTYYRKTKREAESCGTPDDPVNKVYREDYCTQSNGPPIQGRGEATPLPYYFTIDKPSCQPLRNRKLT